MLNDADAAISCDAPFDWAAALERVDGDEEFLRSLVELFLADCPTWQTKMRQAVAEGDWEALRRTAHTIKGAAVNFEAGALVQAGQALENAAAERKDQDMPVMLNNLEAELERLQHALRVDVSSVD